MENDKLNKISQEMKAKQAEAIKNIVRLTLEQVQSIEIVRDGLQEQLKILKFDLIDLKEGRLDRIYERQETNENCKNISILKVSKNNINNSENNPWYINYQVAYNLDNAQIITLINNSITKIYASGTYKLKDGVIKYL